MGASTAERGVGSRVVAIRPDGTVNGAVAWERYGTGEPVPVVPPVTDKAPDPEYPW